jgi:hypothetical protein
LIDRLVVRQAKKEITHEVRELVFKLGDIRDPISGELVVAKEYRKQMDQVTDRG